MYKLRLEKQKNLRSNWQHLLDHGESKGIPEEKIYFCIIDYVKAFNCGPWKIVENS